MLRIKRVFADQRELLRVFSDRVSFVKMDRDKADIKILQIFFPSQHQGFVLTT